MKQFSALQLQVLNGHLGSQSGHIQVEYYIYIYIIFIYIIYTYWFTMEDHHYLEDHPTDRNCLVTVVMTIAQLQMG